MNFEQKTLGQLSKDGRGYYGIGASAVPYSDELFTYLRITDIRDDGTLNRADFKSVADPEASKYLLYPNDIVFARTGASTGRNYFYDGRDGTFVYAGFLIKFSINESQVNPRYIKHYCRSKNYWDWIAAYNTGSTRGNINAQTLASMPIMLPPREYQDRVVSILDSLDDKIKLNNRINENLQAQARALYKAWFIDYVPFGGSCPDGWKTGKLKDALTLKRNAIKAGENTELPYLPIDVIPMNTFALSDVKPNEEAQSSLITFDKDDIVIGAMRVYFHRVIIAPFAGITRTTCFTIKPSDSDYLCFGLLCCDQDSSIEYAQTTSKGSTMPYAVWDGGLGDMDIVIPDKDTAHEFNEVVMPMIRTIQSSYEENKLLRDLRDSLLPRLMSGEIDVFGLDL